MTLQQFRYLCKVVDSGMSIARAADALCISQPRISKVIKSLENEVGFPIFIRKGNRFVGVSDHGLQVVAGARRMLSVLQGLKEYSEDKGHAETGTLRIATTHFQARYALLDVIKRFSAVYPRIDFHLVPGSMSEIVQWVLEGRVHFGLSATPPDMPKEITVLDVYEQTRCVITPKGYPLHKMKSTTIEDLARYPLIAYDEGLNGGLVVRREFEKYGLAPRVAMKAIDADTMKAYVAAGIGIAVIQTMALNSRVDGNLKVLKQTHLFPSSMTRVILRSDQYLRGYMREFLRMVSPRLLVQLNAGIKQVP